MKLSLSPQNVNAWSLGLCALCISGAIVTHYLFGEKAGGVIGSMGIILMTFVQAKERYEKSNSLPEGDQ